jgi:hypothetical protein
LTNAESRSWPAKASDAIRAKALALGFDACGFARGKVVPPRFVVKLSFAILLLSAQTACGTASSYDADLAVNFQCGAPPSEGEIESFLAKRGFSVANEERVRRQFNLGFYPMQIEAHDQRRRTVEFMGLGAAAGANTYDAAIYSPPPTRHDRVLEEAFGQLISKTLKCQITSITRGSNPASASSFYDRLFRLQLSREHETVICDRSLASFNEKLCQEVPGVPRAVEH